MIRSAFSVFLFGSLVAILFLGGCKDDSTNPVDSKTVLTGQDTVTISMAGNTFNPASPVISQHTTIIWSNNSGSTHTSTSTTNIWDTGDIAPGRSTTTTFRTVGTFPYYCRYHSMMVGTITVE